MVVCVSCSSEVPDVAAVLRSPAGPPEGSEQSEAETDETSGSDQPARSGSPAQVTAVRQLWLLPLQLLSQLLR